MLSTFGAIGFILVNNIEAKDIIISVVGFAGGVGIFILWLIDLKVYQQLLAANFIEGVRLEEEYPWLPQVRHNMIDTQNTGSVINNLSWFYIIGIVLPTFIGAGMLTKSILHFDYLWGLFSILCFCLIIVYITSLLIDKSEEKGKNRFSLGKKKGTLIWAS